MQTLAYLKGAFSPADETVQCKPLLAPAGAFQTALSVLDAVGRKNALCPSRKAIRNFHQADETAPDAGWCLQAMRMHLPRWMPPLARVRVICGF